VTIQDAYPLPRIDESLDALAGSKYFTTLDLLSGYWQVPLSPDAQENAAFITRDGLWKWKVLPFGLTSAPATFQRKTLLIYLNDVIVISPDFKTHVSCLREIFEKLRGAGLKLKPSKCALLQSEVKYLRHDLTTTGNVESQHSTYLYEVCLASSSEKPVTITCFGLDQITGKVSSLNLQVIKELFPNLDPNLFQRHSDEVDILIEADLCCLHPRQVVATAGSNLKVLNMELTHA